MSNSELILHPFYISRVAGVSVDLLSHTETGRLPKILSAKNLLVETISSIKNEMCSLLERKIHGNSNKELVRRLLKIKRSFYNGKMVELSFIEQIGADLAANEWQEICNFNGLLIDLFNQDELLKSAYIEDIEGSRDTLNKIWAEPFLHDALAYSNPQLFLDINKQIYDGKYTGKKRQLIEDTLLQYFLRSATKTSPLSTFTLVSVAEWGAGQEKGFSIDFSDKAINKVEIKSAILREAIDRSFLDFSSVKKRILLQLNPSINFQDGHIFYNKKLQRTASNNRVWGTLESAFSVKLNAMLKCVFHVFQSENSSITFEILLAKILQLSSKLIEGDVSKYIEHLYGVGIIQPDYKLYEQENILTSVGRAANYFHPQKKEMISVIVENIEIQMSQYTASHANERAQLTESIAKQVRLLARTMVEDEGMEVFGPEFYENSYIEHKSSNLDSSVFHQFKESFELLLSCAPLTDIAHYGQSQFADYFVSKYGVDGVCKEVSVFISEVDEIYNPNAQGSVMANTNAAKVSEISHQYMSALENFDKYILECFESCNGQDIELDPEKLSSIIKTIPKEINNRDISNSYMGHLLSVDGKNCFVLNQVFGGRSFLFSRFLELQSEDELSKVKSYLKNSTSSDRQLELPGVFGFDANKHPQLLTDEVSIPGFYPNWKESEKVNINKLSLKYDASTHKVIFFDSENKHVDIWYQGFLVPVLLPQTQRVVAVNNGDGVSAIISAVIMKSKFIVPGKISTFPRVSLGGVVLFRRMTVFFRNHMPDPTVDSFEFFKSVQLWKEENNLPNEVFVRLSLLSMELMQGYDKNFDWDNFSYKDSKPFYVKLDNPRMVRLLARALKRNDFPVTVTEVLPSMRDQHASINGRPHICELLFEITKKHTSVGGK